MSYFLGIGDVTHDASVCLMKNNKMISAIELERITRFKHGFNLDSKKYDIISQANNVRSALSKLTREEREKRHLQCIEYCLNQKKLSLDDMDIIAISSLFNSASFCHQSVFIRHHLAHCASTFFPSSFEEAAILVLDGYGEFIDERSETTMFAFGKENHIKVLDCIEGECHLTKEEKQQVARDSHIVFKNSLGVFYQNITMLLKLGYYGEGKTMGLSAYGKENPTLDKIREYVVLLPDGKIQIDNRSIFFFCKNILQNARNFGDLELFKLKADLAFIHQDILEKAVFHLCCHLYKITESDNLCLAGGVALNSVANGKILKNTPFKNIFIQPAAGDNGISIGCAFYAAHALRDLPRFYLKQKVFSPFTGKTYEKDEINVTLEDHKDKIREVKIETPLRHAAKLISEGKVIGWFNGGSEIGPRALGNRSILADPRNPKMKNYLNEEVKHREWFRPYAPVIMAEKTQEYFAIDHDAPYMLQVTNVLEEKRKIVPAITHVDGSARLQTIRRELNADYYDIIKYFEEITGVPVILNTSFNGQGEPIVETPEDAIKCFIANKIDVLFLNKRVILKI